MKRRMVSMLLCVLMVISVASCGDKAADTPTAAPTAGTAASTPADSSTPDTAADTQTATPAAATSPPDMINTPDYGEGETPTPPPEDDTPAPPAEKPNSLNIAITADNGALSMELMTTDVYGAMACVQEPLWDVLEDGTKIMVRAESVDEPSDYEMIIHLRDVKFSNGNPLDAEDVLFSLDLYKAAGMSGGPRVQTIVPENCKIIDENTVSLGVEPNIARWQILSQFFIYDKESYDASSNPMHPIGTGPYKLTDYIPNSSLKLERRDDYWGETPAYQYLNFQLLAEDAQRANAVETGEMDYAAIAITDVERIKSLPNVYMLSRYTQTYTMMNFNIGPNSEFYHNVDAKRAICHAIDPEAILNVMYLGQGKVVHAPINPICFDYEDRFDYMDEVYQVGYNVELAKQYAQSSGLAGKTIQLLASGDTRLAEMVQSMVQAIGVNVEINTLDPAAAFNELYNIDSTLDFQVSPGISPNRIVGDQLLNGVRYFPQMVVPGAFENNEEYLERAPSVMSELDEEKHKQITYELLQIYEENVLSFGICTLLVSNAFSNKIDPSTITYSIGTGMVRLQDLKPF